MINIKRHYRFVNEKEFKLIKTLQDAGVMGKKLKLVTGRSSSALSYISKAKDFNEYKQQSKERTTKRYGNGEMKTEPVNNEYQARFEQKLLNRLDTIIKLLEDQADRSATKSLPDKNFFGFRT